MKEGWEYKKLKEVGLTQTGTTPSKQIKSFYGGDIPFIRPAELNIDQNGGILYESELKLTEEGALKARVIKENSVLMCCIGSVGKTGFTLRSVTCNQQINTITPYDNYNPKFVYYALISPSFQQEVTKIANSAKATLPIISKGKWEVLSIPIPSLSEQQSIVDYLDSAFAKIDAMKANAEKALNEAKALFQASLKEMLEPKEGWEEKKLDDICYSVEDGDWIESKDQSPNGIRLIQTGNIGNGVYKDKQDSAKYISEETFKRLNCTEIFEGDILVSRLPDPVGRACILPDLGCRCITAVDCSILRLKKDIVCNAWISYYMQSLAYFSIIKAQCTGSTRLRITRKKLAEILIPLPSLSEQQSIVDTLDTLKSKVDRLQENYDKISQECDALKQAILRQVFE